MNSFYRHKQIGILVIVTITGMIVFDLVLMFVIGPHPIVLSVTVVLALLLLCFGTLTITVDRERAVARFGPGPIHKKFLTSEIRDARCVRNKWYYGWGIRLTPHGWLYNVSGLDAVEIEMANGRKYRLGTDEPRELLSAIKKATGPHVA